MTPAWKQVIEKFEELIDRDSDIEQWTKPERMVWYTIIIRSEIVQDGFSSVFDQALDRAEMVEAIGYMWELGWSETAELFEEALHLYDANGYYDAEARVNIPRSVDREAFNAQVDQIGEQIIALGVLWFADEQLTQLL